MRKAIFVAAVTGLVLFTACKKNETSSGGNAGGTWTFKGITYQAPGCDTASGTLLASVPPGVQDGGSKLGVDFFSNVPTAAGSYMVITGTNTINNASQVEVGITDLNGNYYISTGNSSATVSATLTGGKVALSGTGIELVNLNNASDSASLTFSIVQTD